MPRSLQRNQTKYLLRLLGGKDLCANPFLYQQPGRYLRWREYSFGALLEPVVNLSTTFGSKALSDCGAMKDPGSGAATTGVP